MACKFTLPSIGLRALLRTSCGKTIGVLSSSLLLELVLPPPMELLVPPLPMELLEPPLELLELLPPMELLLLAELELLLLTELELLLLLTELLETVPVPALELLLVPPPLHCDAGFSAGKVRLLPMQ